MFFLVVCFFPYTQALSYKPGHSKTCLGFLTRYKQLQHGVQRRMISVVNFFLFFRLFFALLLQFHGHHSHFRKDFQMLLSLKEGHT